MGLSVQPEVLGSGEQEAGEQEHFCPSVMQPPKYCRLFRQKQQRRNPGGLLEGLMRTIAGGSRQPTKPRAQEKEGGGGDDHRCLTDVIFIPVEHMVHCLEGGGSSDTVNSFDAFNREGAQLFEINSRILYEVLFLKNTWHLASMLSQRKCLELEGWLQ